MLYRKQTEYDLETLTTKDTGKTVITMHLAR